MIEATNEDVQQSPLQRNMSTPKRGVKCKIFEFIPVCRWEWIQKFSTLNTARELAVSVLWRRAAVPMVLGWFCCSFALPGQECLTTGFRFSVTHDDPPFGQSEPHDERGGGGGVSGNSGGGPSLPGDDDTLVRQPQQQQPQQTQQVQQEGGCGGGGGGEKPVTCDYLSPYAFTARNSLGSTSG